MIKGNRFTGLAVYFCKDVYERRLIELFELITSYPEILLPSRGADDKKSNIINTKGFMLYPTIKKTTLVFDKEQDIFIKILHPVRKKERILSILRYNYHFLVSKIKKLLEAEIKIPEIVGHGYFKKGTLPFYIFRKLHGDSLYNILIRRGETVAFETIEDALNCLSDLHKKGFYMGDAHLSHIFVNEGGFEGFIDIDGIRKVGFFKKRCYAKDLGYLNHPQLPFTKEEKQTIFDSYCNRMGIDNREHFKKLIREYTKKRWRA